MPAGLDTFAHRGPAHLVRLLSESKLLETSRSALTSHEAASARRVLRVVVRWRYALVAARSVRPRRSSDGRRSSRRRSHNCSLRRRMQLRRRRDVTAREWSRSA